MLNYIEVIAVLYWEKSLWLWMQFPNRWVILWRVWRHVKHTRRKECINYVVEKRERGYCTETIGNWINLVRGRKQLQQGNLCVLSWESLPWMCKHRYYDHFSSQETQVQLFPYFLELVFLPQLVRFLKFLSWLYFLFHSRWFCFFLISSVWPPS